MRHQKLRCVNGRTMKRKSVASAAIAKVKYQYHSANNSKSDALSQRQHNQNQDQVSGIKSKRQYKYMCLPNKYCAVSSKKSKGNGGKKQ